ncbi:MAG: TIGR01244 family phosphatase [Rhodobacteraceae bacterium]|nr:TIGR01244 family phosphatase [Paracoccaceae bacterium]
MDIKRLSPDYAVTPQVTPADVAAIRDAGFATVICNRPDGEIPPDLQAASMRREVEQAGLAFVLNPVIPGRFTGENLAIQQEAMATATGPVLAYCASGNRSALVWSMLKVQDLGVDGVLAATRAAGYDHSPFRAQFKAIAEGA